MMSCRVLVRSQWFRIHEFVLCTASIILVCHLNHACAHLLCLVLLQGLHVFLLLLLYPPQSSHTRTHAEVVSCRVGKGLHAYTRNPRGSGGLLPACKATSYYLDDRQGPTCRMRVKSPCLRGGDG